MLIVYAKVETKIIVMHIIVFELCTR